MKLFPFKSIIRFGSVTESEIGLEINSVEAIKNSASKLRMKKCFDAAGVKTAKWGQASNLEELLILGKSLTNDWKNSLVCKSLFGSRGRGNTLVDSEEALKAWTNNKDLNNYIFEKYYNYTREYRLHVDSEGCFYTCRKMLKGDTPEDKKWMRNDATCSWFLDSNPLFNKPSNWNVIEDECVKALKAVGLDIGACDIRVNKDEEFIILEINSAPSMAPGTLTKYLETLPKLLEKKLNLVNN